MVLKEYVLIWLAGYSPAVLGDISTGKSTLIRYLYYGELIKKPTKTTNEETHPPYIHKIEYETRDGKACRKDIRLRKITDYGGERHTYQNKKVLFWKSNLALYLIRSDLFVRSDLSDALRTGDQEKAKRTISVDFQHMKSWISKFRPTPQLFVVGNYFGDENECRIFTDPQGKSRYEGRFADVVQNLNTQSGTLPISRTIAGSLATEELAKQLIRDIFGG